MEPPNDSLCPMCDQPMADHGPQSSDDPGGCARAMEPIDA
jgi:hypothetical protein